MTAASRTAVVTVPATIRDGSAGLVRDGEPSAVGSRLRRLVAFAGDALLLLLVAFAFPFVVLLVGMPIAALVWVVAEVAKRVF